MKPYEIRHGRFLMSDDKRKLDMIYAYDLLCTPSKTSTGLPPKRFPIVMRNSLCFGVYDGAKQIGFGRVITDYSEFASVWDIFVDEAYRGKGLGKALMKMIMEDPKIKGVYRWFLMTEDAHKLYEKFGFRRESFNPYFMMRINRDAND
ncbi:MAG: GNAT family N-acetyltransferase [Gammaproteobacteria bacterium]